jgi:hypothetical protein
VQKKFSIYYYVRKANSIIKSFCNDDGTIPNAWGSLNIDDEGNKTRKYTNRKWYIKGLLNC